MTESCKSHYVVPSLLLIVQWIRKVSVFLIHFQILSVCCWRNIHFIPHHFSNGFCIFMSRPLPYTLHHPTRHPAEHTSWRIKAAKPTNPIWGPQWSFFWFLPRRHQVWPFWAAQCILHRNQWSGILFRRQQIWQLAMQTVIPPELSPPPKKMW